VKRATHWPRASRARIAALLCDIDGTITLDGRLPASAYRALEQLHDAGLLVVPVTGRPAGWCDLIARFWPVAAVVGENGAFYFRYDHAARRMTRRYVRSDAERAHDRERLEAIGADVLRQVPGARLAADQAYREADLAIDWCEDVAPLPPREVQRIVDQLHAHGLTVKVSSIHVNAWFGRYDKLTMARRLLAEQLGIDVDAERDRVAFVGDSPNDEPMFAFFPNSIAVANIAQFADSIEHRPAYVTRGAEGTGFAELARLLLAARRQPCAVSSPRKHARDSDRGRK
jgi:HAD superfamily hydrolase (TIGR01484 family)